MYSLICSFTFIEDHLVWFTEWLITVLERAAVGSGALSELLSEPDEDSFWTSDVAESVHVCVVNHRADELGAQLAEPSERVVDVLHGEHDAQVTEGVHRGDAVIGDHRRREEPGQLKPAVTVWRTHHG